MSGPCRGGSPCFSELPGTQEQLTESLLGCQLQSGFYLRDSLGTPMSTLASGPHLVGHCFSGLLMVCLLG